MLYIKRDLKFADNHKKKKLQVIFGSHNSDIYILNFY